MSPGTPYLVLEFWSWSDLKPSARKRIRDEYGEYGEVERNATLCIVRLPSEEVAKGWAGEQRGFPFHNHERIAIGRYVLVLDLVLDR